MPATLADEIFYLPDAQVDACLDLKLRHLLSECFKQSPLMARRYFNEPPPHRFLIDRGDHVAAHLAVHEKAFQTNETVEAFTGIAEVCVAPAYRGRGLVRAMLKLAEAKFSEYAYSLLLGDSGVYGSSGYHRVNNVYFSDVSTAPNPDVLVKCLAEKPWHKARVTVEGPTF